MQPLPALASLSELSLRDGEMLLLAISKTAVDQLDVGLLSMFGNLPSNMTVLLRRTN